LASVVSFGRATTNPEFPHASLNKAVAEVFWGISQHIGRFHLEFLYTRGNVYVRTCKRHYNQATSINRCYTCLAIPDDNWLELKMMDVLMIRKNPVYLFIRFNTAGPNVDPILDEINRRLQDINDNRTRILGPTPLGSGSFGHVFPLGSKSRLMSDENWELKALKVLNIGSRDSFENILRGVSTLKGD